MDLMARETSATKLVTLVTRVLLGDQTEDVGTTVGAQEPLPEVGVLEEARDAGQGLEMIAGGARRREQGKEEMGRVAVHGIELDALAAPAQAGDEAIGPRQLAM